MTDCIFCQIAEHKLPAKIQYEDEEIIAFDDINPKAPIHILIVPKKHIESVGKLQSKDANLIVQMFLAIQKIAHKNKLSGYRLAINVGKDGGQIVPHLHFHFLGGNPRAIV